MSTSERCAICRKPDLRRLIELGWNAKMSAAALSACFGNIPSQSVILKHLHEHVDDGASNRTIAVVDAKSMRERVSTLQQTMVEEVERRVTLAQEATAAWNTVHPDDPRDWSWYFNVLDKDVQSAIGSIVKMQGLNDKREMGKAVVGVEVAKLMLGSSGDGLAPRRLTAGIEDGDAIEGEVIDG